MNRMRARRRATQWQRYCDRYITPERGGFIDNAMPIGSIKAIHRKMGVTYADRYVRLARKMRRSQ